MTISDFVQEYLPEIKEPTVRNRINKESLVLEKIKAISRRKVLAQYRISILDAVLLKDFLLLGSIREAMTFEDMIKKLNLSDKKNIIKIFINENKEELIESNILDSDMRIKKIHKLLEKYYMEQEK